MFNWQVKRSPKVSRHVHTNDNTTYCKLTAVSRIYSRIYSPNLVKTRWKWTVTGRTDSMALVFIALQTHTCTDNDYTVLCLITRTAFNTMLVTIKKYHNTTVAQSIQYTYSMCSGCTCYYKDHCPTATLVNHSSACELGTNNPHLHIYCHWAIIRDAVNTC